MSYEIDRRCHYDTMGFLFNPPLHLVLFLRDGDWVYALLHPNRGSVLLRDSNIPDQHALLRDEETSRVTHLSARKSGNEMDP